MPFAQRNIYYLRASPRVVLQTVLYIDPSHLRWMNAGQYIEGVVGDDEDEDEEFEKLPEAGSTGDDVWARALSSLRTKIMPKLLRESIDGQLLSSTNKKEKVDVHIDRDFQMAYFFRKTTGRHAVLLKEKTLMFPQQREMGPPAISASAMRSYQSSSTMPPSRLAARQRRNDTDVIAEGEAIAQEHEAGPSGVQAMQRMVGDGISGSSTSRSAVSKRRRSSPEPVDRSIRVKQEEEEEDEDVIAVEDPYANINDGRDEAPAERHDAVEVEDAIDEKKPKLEVSYSGFQIFGKCLIIVIEPTKRVKKSRPALFQASKSKEKSQLSATPVPDTPDDVPISSSRLRAPSTTSRPQDSNASGRADSRRLTTPSSHSGNLFRGTPSDWEPTPPPSSRRGSEALISSPVRPRSSSAIDSNNTEGTLHNGESDNNDDDDEEDEMDTGSVMLATQMLEGGNMPNQGNDIDDD